MMDTLEKEVNSDPNVSVDTLLDDNHAIRPRVATYGGRELNRHRLRTISVHESDPVKDICNRLVTRIKIGSHISTGSIFGSYIPLPGGETVTEKVDKNSHLGQNSANSHLEQNSANSHLEQNSADPNLGQNSTAKYIPGKDSKNGESDDEENAGDILDNKCHHNAEPLKTEDWLAWKILIFCTLNLVLQGMNWVVFPVFYGHFIRHFTVSHLVAGWIGSLQNATSQVLGLVTSAPVKIFGCRPVAMLGAIVSAVGLALSALAPNVPFLYISFGIISGIGMSMASLPSFVIIQQHFHKNRSIATAISMMGFSFGQVIGPITLDALINTFQWRGALLIFSAIILNGIPIGMQFQQPKTNTSTPQNKNKSEIVKQLLQQILDFSLLKYVPFTLFCLSFFLVKFNVLGYYQHLTSRMVHLGMTSTLAATLLTITAIFTATNRLISGFIGNLKCTNRTLMLAVFMIVGGIDTCLLPLATTFYTAVLVCGIYGACLGTIMLMPSVVMVDMLGVDNITRSTGLYNAFSGIAGLLATPFTGLLFDVSDNYDLPFYVIGVMGLMGGILTLIVVFLQQKYRYHPPSYHPPAEQC